MTALQDSSCLDNLEKLELSGSPTLENRAIGYRRLNMKSLPAFLGIDDKGNGFFYFFPFFALQTDANGMRILRFDDRYMEEIGNIDIEELEKRKRWFVEEMPISDDQIRQYETSLKTTDEQKLYAALLILEKNLDRVQYFEWLRSSRMSIYHAEEQGLYEYWGWGAGSLFED